MHVGLSCFFQNPDKRLTDREVWLQEVALADAAEPMGFDSIWSAEHHFTDYTMCPSVTQFLTYMAGRTSRVGLGTMVVVLPWHEPVRVAEELALLDHLSGGRTIFGMGRGLGRVEFEGFRLNMGESRERFVEYAEAVMSALETGVIESGGKHLRQPPTAIRPAPFKSFRGRTYAASVSPQSAEIMARLGIGILIIAQKPWEKTLEELEHYRELYRRHNNGEEAPKPIVASFVAVHEDRETAREMYESHIVGYCRSALQHYEFHNEGLADIPGYEYYGALARNIRKHGIEAFVRFLADLQVWGTPDEVVEGVLANVERAGCGGFLAALSYGGMPYAMARENQRLFAEKVLPRLKAHDAGVEIGAAPNAAGHRIGGVSAAAE